MLSSTHLCVYVVNSCYRNRDKLRPDAAQQGKTQSYCQGQVNFALGQMKMKVWWSCGQVKLASVVLLVKKFQIRNNFKRLQDEQNNELKAKINLVDKAWTLCTYWASNILMGATEN